MVLMMSVAKVVSVKQVKFKRIRRISCDLKQAIKVINAEYQRIDWEDQDFLNRVLTEAIEALEAKEDAYANS